MKMEGRDLCLCDGTRFTLPEQVVAERHGDKGIRFTVQQSADGKKRGLIVTDERSTERVRVALNWLCRHAGLTTPVGV